MRFKDVFPAHTVDEDIFTYLWMKNEEEMPNDSLKDVVLRLPNTILFQNK